MGQAEAQISVKSEELKQAQLEITEKMAALEVTETQLNQSAGVLQASKKTVEEQLTNLENSKAAYDQANKRKDELENKGTPLTPEEQAELASLKEQIAQLQPIVDNYAAAKAAREASLAQLSQN